MKDITLWRLLSEGATDGEALLPLLEEAAALPLEERLPFLGFMLLLLAHADARVRAAAFKALAGAQGVPAFRYLVKGLYDADADVRRAALGALARSAQDDPARWAHAIFHPDGDMRRQALAWSNRALGRYAAYLIADTTCRDLVLASIDSWWLEPSALPVIEAFLEAAWLPRSQARRIIAHSIAREPLAGLDEKEHRTKEEVEAIYAAALAGDTAAIARIASSMLPIERRFDLFWDTPEPGEERAWKGSMSPQEFFFEKVQHIVAGSGDKIRTGAIGTGLIATAVRRGAWPIKAAEACLLAHVQFALFPWVPPEIRRAAALALYRHRRQHRNVDAAIVGPLIRSDLCCRPSGSLDLEVIGAFLHLVPDAPLSNLWTWVRRDAVIDAVLQDPEAAVPFFRIWDDSLRGSRLLLDGILARRQGPAVLAQVIAGTPTDKLEFVQGLTPTMAAIVFRELSAMIQRSTLKISDRKAARLGALLGRILAGGDLDGFLRAVSALSAPHESTLVVRIVSACAQCVTDPVKFVSVVKNLDPWGLRRILQVVEYCSGFPFGLELRLAAALCAHPDDTIRKWARAHTFPAGTDSASARAKKTQAQELPKSTARAIATMAESLLEGVLFPCIGTTTRGLCAALASRPAPREPNLAACLALLGTFDPIGLVDEQFCRFASTAPRFLKEFDKRVVKEWCGTALPLFGNAWLHLWEEHCCAFGEQALAEFGTFLGTLRCAETLRSPALRAQMWGAVASLLEIWGMRNRTLLAQHVSTELVTYLVGVLAKDDGADAARILVAMHRARVAPEQMAKAEVAIRAVLPSLDPEVRRALSFWIESKGLDGALSRKTTVRSAVSPELLAEIKAISDLDRLEQLCRDQNESIVQEAALRLVVLGDEGLARLYALLWAMPPLPAAATIAATLPWWPEGPWIDAARDAFSVAELPPDVRFRIGVALVARGARELLPRVFDIARAETVAPWFAPEHWGALRRLGIEEEICAVELADSAQPCAYFQALEALLAQTEPSAAVVAAVERFLAVDSRRERRLRVRAANWLLACGNTMGLPILLVEVAVARGADRDDLATKLLVNVPEPLAVACTAAILCTGTREHLLADLMAGLRHDPRSQEACLRIVMADAEDLGVRTALLDRVPPSVMREWKLSTLAHAHAWGVRQGRILTGRSFTIRMHGGQELGWTRLQENLIFVNPLPVFRQEPHGDEIVKGLIVHEIGHHLCHRGSEATDVWAQAAAEGIAGLLNLVADEHLERRLRALDASYGDMFKRLAAYAFQHSDREVSVDMLLGVFKAQSFAVLTSTRLGPARRRGCVKVKSGALLLELSRQGSSFGRFLRALRMGLGVRSQDPKVTQGLALFGKDFRHLGMQGLLGCARWLREVFAQEAELLNAFSQDTALSPDPIDVVINGDGITDGELQKEIERELNPRTRPKGTPTGQPVRVTNVGSDEDFNVIQTVVPVPFDPAQHRRYASQVAREAARMRRFLRELGLVYEEERFRVRGRALDRARVPAVVLRGDPRILRARRLKERADLFLGVLVDCSGSMAVNMHIERAKLFAVLLAEAARGLRGVDVRIFGFTDTIIFDAGTAERCAAHALRSEGGNNDAAALWHAAQAALRSGRKARVLVMISDGAPTECTTTALRALVGRLTTRAKICCAQVAVRPLPEICFPHYVVLESDNDVEAVVKFGRIVGTLVRRTMRAS